MTVELWGAPETEYAAKCYFWCTLDGKAPKPPPGKPFDDGDRLIKLVAGAGLTPIDMKEEKGNEQETEYVSPVSIYHLDVNQGGSSIGLFGLKIGPKMKFENDASASMKFQNLIKIPIPTEKFPIE